jgi:hypothetical protein
MALAAGLTGCGNRTAQTATTPAPPVAAPLATSIHAAGGTWATLPMGHPGDPLNTFWQLFYRAAGSSSWSDQVDATATATNGGLVLASGGGKSLLVGIRPSGLLHFSPLIATSNGGRTWTDGLAAALLARPAALAADVSAAGPDLRAAGPDLSAAAAGPALALAALGPTTTVQESAGDLTTWRNLISLPQLAGTPGGRSCGPDALGAVGYAQASPVLGARCDRPGVVGLFVLRSGVWQRAGADLPGSLAGARIDVLSLLPTDGGLAAVLAASAATGPSLLAAWSRDDGVNWAVSPALPLLADQLTSMGAAAGDGLFVLMSSSTGSQRLDLVDGPGAAWHSLAVPPAGTATVAFGPAGGAGGPGTAQALTASGTVLTIWTLSQGSSGWVKGQTLRVPIQFGSSS